MLLFLVGAELLYVDSVFHLQTLQYRGFVILLTSTELFDNTSLLKLSFKLLQRSLDVLTIFYGYDNHFLFYFFRN